ALRRLRTSLIILLIGMPIFIRVIASTAQRGPISNRPDTPFKLATFEAGGKLRIGLVLERHILDINARNAALMKSGGLQPMTVPGEMRELIEAYDKVKPRLYQLANYYKTANLDGSAFTFDVDKVSIKAPIKYPYNILAIAANYKLH